MARALLLSSVLAAAAALTTADAARSVTFDSRSFIIDGERVLLQSGSIHYQRVVPADWPRVLALAVEMGMNAVQTYVFADEHAPSATGPWDFSGRNNLTAFTSLAASLGLKVVVRIGPYACGEHFNGGVPLWMREKASCFRCSDPGWLAFTTLALNTVVGELEAHGQLWPSGGPVVALQVENEYNGSDEAYLAAALAAARAATSAVPWLLCHDLALCARVNNGTDAALCTINGFWEDGSTEGVQQPSPAFVRGQRALNPRQPIMWTEDQGWFNDWSTGQRVRRTSDILYGVSRSLAWGVTHHNFYMLTGGSNFAYSAANGVTTAYAPDTAIDYLLLRHEPKFSTMAAFATALARIAPALLAAPAPAEPTPLGAHCELAVFGDVTFVSNTGTVSSSTEIVTVDGLSLTVPNHTVILLQSGAVVFNTSAALDAAPPRVAVALPLRSTAPPRWTTIAERVGYGNMTARPAAGAAPLEQLALTLNQHDYMYYSLAPAAPVNASALHVATCGGEYVYVFADGAALSPLGTPTPPRTSHAFALPATGVARLDVLVSAMGLSTSPTPSSCKGLRAVRAGKADLTLAGWESRWVWAGEAARVYEPAGAAAAVWAPVAPNGGDVPTSWFRATFDLPPAPPATVPLAGAALRAPGAPPQLAYALDLSGATKGVAWVNGFNIGRYSLEVGVCSGPCAPPIHGGACYIFWNACGEPTQRYYHVPTSVLRAAGNLVVLFEETTTVPLPGQGPAAPSPPPAPAAGSVADARAAHSTQRDLSRVALVALDAHPQA